MNDDIPAPTHVTNTPVDHRFEYMDVLRGFALFGVLLANLVFQVNYVATDPEAAAAFPTAELDEIAGNLVHYFVDTKFYTLFAALFGAGFALQFDRLARRGTDGAVVLRRRLLALWLFGLAHTVFLWYGDILLSYASVGFLLFAFRRLSERWLLALGIACVVLPRSVVGAVLQGFGLIGGPVPMAPSPMEIELHRAGFADGGYLDVVRENVGFHWNLMYASGYAYFGVFETLGGLLLGMWALRRWQRDPAWFGRHLQRIATAGAALGIASGLLFVGRPFVAGLIAQSEFPTLIRITTRSLFTTGVLGMSAFYACLVYAALRSGAAPGLRTALAAVGRTALSNYLLQSVLYLLIFTGVGLGLMGRFGTAPCLPIAIAIFTVQAFASRWWLGRFHMGPAEWLWRSLTYGRPARWRTA
jgi:uncharacterized protein